MKNRTQARVVGFGVMFFMLGPIVTSLYGQGPAPSRPDVTVMSEKDSSNDLSVMDGKSVLVDFAQPVRRIAVGQAEIAEATVVSRNEIIVNGKKAGQTSMIVWGMDGRRQFFNVTVRHNRFDANDRMDGVRRELASQLPGQAITVSSENGSIFLRGTVKDVDASARAVAIAETALGGKTDQAGKVVNLLNVEIPPADKQILLKVRFAALDRSKAKQMGINLFSLGLGNTVGGISTGQYTGPTISAGSTGSTSSSSSSSSGSITSGSNSATFSSEYNGLFYFPGLRAGADLEALESKGVTQVLAEPNLVAADGQEASFLAGGEYPFPVAQGSSSGGTTITIQWKEYGVRLNFIPTITPRGTIRLQVDPEVSALDTADAVTVDGTSIPALTVRRVKTEAEMASGQTIVIGGLLDNRETQVLERVPFLSQIPVLGKFFQSMSKSRTNTELIVSVTPEVIDPLPAGTEAPHPDFPEKFLPPNSKIPMHQPDDRPVAQPEKVQTMPVEQFIEMQKKRKELKSDSSKSSGSSSSSSSTSSN